MKFISLVSVLCVFCHAVIAYKILGVLPIASKSHYYIGHNLLKGLANEGHDVTVISPFKEKQPIPNYKEVFLENSWIESRRDMAKDNFMDFNNLYFWNTVFKYYDISNSVMNWTLSSKNLQDFIKIKQTFDVVVVEICLDEALIGFGRYYNAPVIGISAFGASTWTNQLVGTPTFASYVPYPFSHFTDRMTFSQRMLNSLTLWLDELSTKYHHIPRHQEYMEQLFPEAKNWPSLEELRRNVSLVLLNTHTVLGSPRPYAPNMIEVGGMQIQKEVKPLPRKIQTFLDDAKDGAIFVSLGSNVLITGLSEDHFNALVNAFRAHPNHRILVKSDENVVIPSHKLSDVIVEPWFDQQSVLAHKNVKLFVTHGGLLSTTEAVYFAKPIVGIPFFGEQHFNMFLAEQKGLGLCIPIETLTTEKLFTAVSEVLGNPSYSEQAKIMSDRFRDQPRTPLELGMHWVKHVAKNNGAPHLRSVAVELPFYALYNLDVWAFILVTLIFAVFVVLKTLRLIFEFSFPSKKKMKIN